MTRLRATYGESIPDPVDMVMSEWNSNPLFMGGWSQNPVGFSEEEFRVITRNEGRVYFAGEHTSRYGNTMVHGAYDTGVE
jgi:polyamine oxidase